MKEKEQAEKNKLSGKQLFETHNLDIVEFLEDAGSNVGVDESVQVMDEVELEVRMFQTTMLLLSQSDFTGE